MSKTLIQEKDGREFTIEDGLEVKSAQGMNGVTVVDEEKGIVEALVSVTGIKDRVNDIIEPGAYTDTLAARRPKGIMNHDWNQQVSKVLEIKELLPGDGALPKALPSGDPWPQEAGALYIKAQYNMKTQRGRDAYEEAVFQDDQQEWSIGFHVPKEPDASTKKGGVRIIKKLDLYEYSQVLWGAMPNARTIRVKSLFEGDAPDDDMAEDEALELDLEVEDPDPDAEPVDDTSPSKDAKALLGVTAFKALGAFLAEAGYITKELADKVDDVPDEGTGDDEEEDTDDEDGDFDLNELVNPASKYLDVKTAATEIMADVLNDDGKSKLDELAVALDAAIDADDPEAIGAAEDAIVEFLTPMTQANADDDELEAAVQFAQVVDGFIGGPDDEGDDAEQKPETDSSKPSADAEPEPVEKRAFTTAQRRRAAGSGAAMSDGSFPIKNAEDLKNAIHLAGNAKDPSKARAHIKARAKALGCEDKIPDSWKSEDQETEVKTMTVADLVAELGIDSSVLAK